MVSVIALPLSAAQRVKAARLTYHELQKAPDAPDPWAASGRPQGRAGNSYRCGEWSERCHGSAPLADTPADEKAAAAIIVVGISPQPKNVDKQELAAWTSVSRVLLNLNEFIYLD